MSESVNGNENLEWVLVSAKHIVQDKWIDFRSCRYRFPNGEEFEPFYNYSRRNYALIVAQTTEGDFLCVRQYRHGIRRVTIEFPAGGIETNGVTDYEAATSNSAQETALDAAKRELQEETGYTSEEFIHLITIPSNATMADNYAYVYLAKNCHKIGDLHLDDTEFLEPERKSAEEIEALIKDGSFAQMAHVMAWELAKKHL